MVNSPNRSVILALLLDLLTVTLFVVVGRRTHQESSAVAAVFKTLTPFLIGLVLAWVIARIWERPLRLQTGVIVWGITLVAGMFTRRVLFGEGIATTFIVVTALFLGASFCGWRLIALQIGRRGGNTVAISRGSS